jgi:hypothetical protein
MLLVTLWNAFAMVIPIVLLYFIGTPLDVSRSIDGFVEG